ncbi:ATP/GTP-binding protein [Candidatus Aerophobetes bacterium]|nr:ATP/GTP-binding protein [Candidatus Aerophobetes bacterium]
MPENFFLSEEILEQIIDGGNRTIMVIGASDSGKTTFVEQIAKICSLTRKTAIVDIDPGQSHIGPPTTVAWGMVEKKEFEGWEKLKIKGFYFVGDTSPTGNLLPVITGARLMWDEAIRQADKVILDTTGLVRGNIGKILKLHLIDLLKPEVIFALYREDELEHILSFFRGVKFPRIFKLPVPSDVILKDFTFRRNYRQKKFRDYFKFAREIEFIPEEIGISKNLSPDYLNMRLISLRDKNNQDIALGIIKELNERKDRVVVYSPVSNPERVGAVVFGRLKLTLEGVEMRF